VARANRTAARKHQPTDDTPRPAGDPGAIARIGAFLPGSSTDDGGSGDLLFLAAGALLALVCASGSFVAVASRISKGQLR
jgi:hypothetical protein